MYPVNVSAKFAIRSFSRSWDNSDFSFGVGSGPPILGKGGRTGSGMVPFERAFVTSYRLSIITFPLSLRVSEIGLLPLLCSSTPLFPTPPLFWVFSPKFPYVPLGAGEWPLGYEERRCWANCPCNQFPRFPTCVILIHQRHRQTDGQTDGRTTCNLNTALCSSASRGKKSPCFYRHDCAFLYCSATI